MLTDFMVTCPRPGCHWSGSLLPAGSLDVWRPALPGTNVIVFCCEINWWRARRFEQRIVEELPGLA